MTQDKAWQMKLYATATSERASKGQGGNKQIDILLQAENPDRQAEYSVHYEKTVTGTKLVVRDLESGLVILAVDKKGKQQKGER